MRDQSNVIIIQANEKSKEVTMKIKKEGQDESYEYEEESYYEEDAENQENHSEVSPQKRGGETYPYESNDKKARQSAQSSASKKEKHSSVPARGLRN